MSHYHVYPPHRILLRRSAVIFIGIIALPVMIFRHDRACFYSYLHRIWYKNSDKPVWLKQVEMAPRDFY